MSENTSLELGRVPPRDLRLKMIDNIAEGARNSLGDCLPMVLLMLTPNGEVIQISPNNVPIKAVADCIKLSASIITQSEKNNGHVKG